MPMPMPAATTTTLQTVLMNGKTYLILNPQP